ncbi:MAG: hypothetical protein ABI823_21905, partial [Bryobacteraceae bacterium]
MTKNSMKQLVSSLSRERESAAGSLASMRDALLELEIRGDSGEQGRNLAERRGLIEGIVATQQRVERIDAAFERVDDGTYGVCIGCAEPIRPRRLTAQP